MKAIGYLHKYIHWETKVDSQWVKKVLSVFGVKITFSKQQNLAPILNRYFNVMKCEPAKGKDRKQQRALMLLLDIFDDICRRYSIRYYIDEGNLLGAFRYGGFIPWDDDVDVTVPLEEYEKITHVLKDETKGTNLKLYGVDDVKWGSILRLTLSGFEYATIDVSFVYCLSCGIERKTEIEKAWEKSKWYYWVNFWEIERNCTENNLKKFRSDTNAFFLGKLSATSAFDSPETQLVVKPLFYNSPHVMKASNVFPLTKMIFEGREYFAPAKTEDYLHDIFGDIYSFPPYFISHGTDFSEADADKACAQLEGLKQHFKSKSSCGKY